MGGVKVHRREIGPEARAAEGDPPDVPEPGIHGRPLLGQQAPANGGELSRECDRLSVSGNFGSPGPCPTSQFVPPSQRWLKREKQRPLGTERPRCNAYLW